MRGRSARGAPLRHACKQARRAPRPQRACAQVEATKFTEVGFHGRDVDQIVRDLVDAAIIQTRARLRRRNRAAIAAAVEERILDAVLGTDSKDNTRVRGMAQGTAAPSSPWVPEASRMTLPMRMYRHSARRFCHA